MCSPRTSIGEQPGKLAKYQDKQSSRNIVFFHLACFHVAPARGWETLTSTYRGRARATYLLPSAW